MSNFRNEKGYALVTVLLIITLFMIFFLAFSAQALNTVKQNKVIETNSQSVALAEMGVTYYEKAIQNVYYENINEIINEVDELRRNQITSPDNNVLDSGDLIKLARDKMFDRINCSLNPNTCLDNDKILLKQSIKDDSDSEFTINKQDGQSGLVFSEGNAIIKSNFISTGIENGEQTSIGGTLEIDFNDIVPGNTIKDPDPEGNKLPDCNNINPRLTDFTNTQCQYFVEKHFANNDKLTFNNSIVKVNGNFSFENLNNENVKSTLYIDGDMTTNNMTSFETLNLHVTGDASFGNFTGSGLAKSIIEIDGHANFENIKLNESDIFISSIAPDVATNPPYLGKIIEMKQSSIYVNSKAKFESIDIGSGSTICVNGPLIFSKNTGSSNISGDGKVYALESTDPKVETDPELFKSECTKFAWGSAVFTAEYDYNYQ